MLFCKHIRCKRPMQIRRSRDHRRCVKERCDRDSQLVGTSHVTAQDGDHRSSQIIDHDYGTVRKFISDRRSDGSDCDPHCPNKNDRIVITKLIRRPFLQWLHDLKEPFLLSCILHRNIRHSRFDALFRSFLIQFLDHCFPVLCKADGHFFHL